MDNKLKGSLLKKTEQKSKLKGKLTNALEGESKEINSENWLKSQIIVQRDGGELFKVKDIITQTHGSSGKKIVQLLSLKDGHSINKELSELIEKIKTPGSPWGVGEK